MCGEHSRHAALTLERVGSSPHVRGALPDFNAPDGITGIIPACAGSTSNIAATLNSLRDHPRMCGEHYVDTAVNPTYAGSSPHVRGAQSGILIKCACRGIIPACAGSTSTASTTRRSGRDHPRMCGEHLGMTENEARARGSSPHVRGALKGLHNDPETTGIIPACAGSTPRTNRFYQAVRDHPRMCGEHIHVGAHITVEGGSSPHVRGALRMIIIFPWFLGIIPACAGSTEALSA